MKKFISLIMSICMVMTSVPVVAYAASSTPKISLDEFSEQLQELQSEYDDNYVNEIRIKNDSEFYFVDGEENIITDATHDVKDAVVTDNDFEIPFSTISDYCDLPEISTYSLDENTDDIILDKETAQDLGFEVEIEDGMAILTQPYQTQRLIVKSKYDINPLDSVAIVEGYNDLHIVQFDNQDSAIEAQEYYEKQKLIEYVEPDLVVSTMDIDYVDNNSLYAETLSDYSNHLSWGSDSIGVDDFIDTLSETNNLPEIIVGIIDTGIDLDHEFLQDRIVETNYNTSGSGTSNSENDDNGHGSHVAGIIVDNTTENIKLESFKVLNSEGRGSTINVVNAIEKAVSSNVNVINMSLGVKGQSSAMTDAVNNAVKKGITVCVAAGNSGDDAKNYSPACISACITVAAMDCESDFPYWTNYGSCVDIIAPGVEINSTYKNGGYETLSGTSMASPFAAAASALFLSKEYALTPNEICNTLQENGHECSPPDKLSGVKSLYIGLALDYNSERTISPIISMASGYYENSISVEITCEDKDAKIYYTTDGTRASETNGILYTEPIVIDKITSLHASAYSPGKLKSSQVYETYYISYIDDENNFVIDSNGIITEYNGDSTYLIIPDTISEITVTGIGSNVFSKSDMVRITFPDTLTYIGDYAFNTNKSLISVRANNIENISSHAFYLCSNLTDIDLTHVENLGDYCFFNAKIDSLCNDKLTYISKYAFGNCKYLININLPNVTELDMASFGSCSRLENASLPNLKIIGANSFNSNYRLNYIYIPQVTEIGYSAFALTRSLKEISILNLCGEIANLAFQYSYIESVCFENATSISDKAFYECHYLESVYIPNVTKIGNNVFYNTSAFKTIFAPSLEISQSLPQTDNVSIYLSEKCTQLPITENKYNIIAPTNSYAEQWANENGYTFLSCDSKTEDTDSSNVTTMGRSICSSVAGIRFGFTWDNIDEIESLANKIEYGFIYSQKGAEDLSIDTVDGSTVKKTLAPNRIESDGTTSFNLVISNIPSAYYDREITARAYVCIDGMYFYSNTLKGSFGEVAGLVLADNEIDQNTKNAVNKLLEA